MDDDQKRVRIIELEKSLIARCVLPCGVTHAHTHAHTHTGTSTHYSHGFIDVVYRQKELERSTSEVSELKLKLESSKDGTCVTLICTHTFGTHADTHTHTHTHTHTRFVL